MSDGVFGVEVVTPEAVLFAGPATSVVLRTSEGDFTVLDGHTPLVGDVVPVVVRVERPDATSAEIVVHGGFVQVATDRGAAAGLVDDASNDERSTRVTVLAGIAELVESLDAERARLARDAATQALAALPPHEEGAEPSVEREIAERALARAELRLEAAGVTVDQ